MASMRRWLQRLGIFAAGFHVGRSSARRVPPAPAMEQTFGRKDGSSVYELKVDYDPYLISWRHRLLVTPLTSNGDPVDLRKYNLEIEVEIDEKSYGYYGLLDTETEFYVVALNKFETVTLRVSYFQPMLASQGLLPKQNVSTRVTLRSPRLKGVLANPPDDIRPPSGAPWPVRALDALRSGASDGFTKHYDVYMGTARVVSLDRDGDSRVPRSDSLSDDASDG